MARLRPKSYRKPEHSVRGRERAAPPGSASASKTSTRKPACASAMAAASPLGPDPMTHARLMVSSLSRQSIFTHAAAIHQGRGGSSRRSCRRRSKLSSGAEEAEILTAPPPIASAALFFSRGKPIRTGPPAHNAAESAGRIAAEQQTTTHRRRLPPFFFGEGNHFVLPPAAEQKQTTDSSRSAADRSIDARASFNACGLLRNEYVVQVWPSPEPWNSIS